MYRTKPCAHPGCKELVIKGKFCKNHQEEYRATTTKWGFMYNRKWKAYRLRFLARPENHWCCECLKHGVHTPATEVDHIIPHDGSIKLFWDMKNHQALCASCHSAKTMRENNSKR